MNEWGGDVDNKEGRPPLDAAAVIRLMKHNECLRARLDSVVDIKTNIALGAFDVAKESWCELDEEDQVALYIAPSKGGIFTTYERKIIHNGFSGE